MVISSISAQTELSAVPPHWFPQHPTFFRYEALFSGHNGSVQMPAGVEKFLRGLVNSLIVSTLNYDRLCSYRIACCIRVGSDECAWKEQVYAWNSQFPDGTCHSNYHPSVLNASKIRYDG